MLISWLPVIVVMMLCNHRTLAVLLGRRIIVGGTSPLQNLSEHEQVMFLPLLEAGKLRPQTAKVNVTYCGHW